MSERRDDSGLREGKKKKKKYMCLVGGLVESSEAGSPIHSPIRVISRYSRLSCSYLYSPASSWRDAEAERRE